MCGLCGVYRFTEPRDLRAELKPMLRAIAHRGTVDGSWFGPKVALGSRRLPIIDVAHSPQPIHNEDRSLVLVGNGEIYNFKELAKDLAGRGHTFSTRGDLECILHLYEEFGDGVWDRLNGMFAVALFDTRRDELTLARDHMGVKPLFYFQGPGFFAFASEIRALRQHPEVRGRVNPQAVADYLSLQFVPRPQTAYEGIRSLPPGSFLKVRGDRAQATRFWRLTVASDHARMSPEEAARATGELFQAAVRRQLVSDVPLGVLLSGGLDSSAIAAVAASLSPSPIKTFAIAFREPTFDESRFSRLMAKHIGADHEELVLDAEAVLDSLGTIAEHMDEPFCEGSIFPIYHICRHAKSRVDVLLAGEGSDEIFGGYETYMARSKAAWYRLLPAPARSLVRDLVRRLPVSDNKVSLDFKLRRFTDGAEFAPAKAHFWWRSSLNDRDRGRVLARDFVRRLERPFASELYEQAFARLRGGDVLDRLMAVDAGLHLPDDLLYRADLMSMASTLELRVPFMDIELVKFAFSIPSRLKIRGFDNKIPLRRAMAGRLPDEVRRRAKKGLNMPYQKWFKGPRWKSFLHDTLTRDRVERGGILDFTGVRSLLTEHEAGRHNHAHGLWTVMNLVLWLQRNAG